MTNANLEGIAQASGGNEITMNYQGGSQKILVPAGRQAGRSLRSRHTRRPEGRPVFTQRISVSKDGIKPPH